MSQIVDDSTKQVYSTKTTKIVLESFLKDNKKIEIHPDSTLYNLEKFTALEIAGDKYQNLGNNGTAMFPMFYTVPNEIGRTSGFNAYNFYAKSSDDFQYYDTKSPFINLMVVFGGEGRSVVDMAFSRNVTENWNFGFDIYRITSDKQIGTSGQQDRNVIGTNFDVYTYFQHPEKPYSLMAHVMNMQFDIEETGGIQVDNLELATNADLFQYQDSDIRLADAQANENRRTLHLFHEYNWTKPLQFYHEFDVIRKKTGYQDLKAGSASTYDSFYNHILIDQDTTYERSEWTEVANEVGIKGDLANLFYRIYLRRRDIDFDMLYLDPTAKFSENFLGGYTRFDWREKFNVEAQAEILQSGEYKLIGNLNSDFIFGSYKSVRYKPSFFSEQYFGNHHEWSNSFNSAFVNEISGGLQLKLNFLKIRPQARISTNDQFMYFDQFMLPRQSNELAILSSIGGDFDLKLITNKTYKDALHFENEFYFTNVSGNGADNIRVPELFYNGKLYWDGFIFKKTTQVEIGVNAHAQSGYYGMDYAPEVQQFYLQDEFFIDRYLTLDFFLSMKVQNVRAFLNWTYVNQPTDGGYFITPYYPGQSQVTGLGVRWLFFD